MEMEPSNKPAAVTSCKTNCGCGTKSKPAATATPAAPAAVAAPGVTADEQRHVPGENRRKTVIDRRSGIERRQMPMDESDYEGPERRSGEERRQADTGLERRRGPGRRRADDRREAEEGEMNTEQFEFIMAIETYKKVNKRIYPTWTEVLEVVRQLGYRKVKPREIHLENVPEPKITAA